jgi:hypothetical protein
MAFSSFLAAGAWAQDGPLDAASAVKFDLAPDSPVKLVSSDLGESRANVRGGAVMLDLHMSVLLRNDDRRHVRGVTLLLLSQEAAPFGKASVTRVFDIAPGESFPVRVDVRMVRPVQSGAGPLVRVSLDGVLFDDLNFFGPNRLNSRRSLIVFETEARRDRAYFRQVLQSRGEPGLRREVLDSLARQAARPQLNVSFARAGRATTSAAEPEHAASFAFLNVPDSPVEPVNGSAEISGNEVRSSRIDVLNRSKRTVRYLEIAWLVADQQGQQFLAASVPPGDRDLNLTPGQRGHMQQNTALRFTRPGAAPVNVRQMTGFVSQVEFADGGVWVPSRQTLMNDRLLPLVAPSPEEQRLTDLYRNKGLAALMAELKRFRD